MDKINKTGMRKAGNIKRSMFKLILFMETFSIVFMIIKGS